MKIKNRMKQYVVFLMLVVVSFMSVKAFDEVEALPQYVYVADESVYFYDVGDKYPWAFHEIDHLAAIGVVQGGTDFRFRPNDYITRGDFALMIYRAYDMSEYLTGENFADVPEDSYYYDAILALKNLKIAAGDNGNFEPEENLTRQDAIVFLTRILEVIGFEMETTDISYFDDANSIEDYAVEYVQKLISVGVVGGIGSNIEPIRNITRAEISIMIYRALMVENTDGVVKYVAHPENVIVCIGEKVYPSIIIENFDVDKTYTGLMELISFDRESETRTIDVGEQVEMSSEVSYYNGTLIVDGEEMLVADDAVAIQLTPYGVMDEFVSTGDEYKLAIADTNSDGEVSIIYYE